MRVELASVPHEGRQPVFAQRYHRPRGPDLKLYVIGERVFGVRKPYPRTTVEEKTGESFTPSPELCAIALACGRTFGIELYGVDVIESDDGCYVVDVGSLPGFRGVPDAPRLLAAHLVAAAQRAARGAAVLSEASRS